MRPILRRAGTGGGGDGFGRRGRAVEKDRPYVHPFKFNFNFVVAPGVSDRDGVEVAVMQQR